MTFYGAEGGPDTDRKSLGAFYTPRDLAKFVAEWSITEPSCRVLEPSFGGGALIDAILERFSEVGAGSLVGVELDDRALQVAQARYGDQVDLCHADFLSVPSERIGEVDVVLANPPFTRNHSLTAARRADLKALSSGVGVTGAAGLWVYFLCHSLTFLKAGGRLAYILPGAASFAHYSRALLNALSSRFLSVEIVHVNEQIQWEGNAQENAVLLLAAGYQQGCTLAVAENNIRRNDQGKYERAPARSSLPLLPHVKLGTLAKIEIGCVTGSNAHFLLDGKTREALDISYEDVTATVARARHISGLSTTTKELVDLSRAGERTLLLTPANIERHRAGVRSQLATIPRDRRRGTLWFKKREPWWSVQTGKQADAVFTYMNHLGPRISLVDAGISITNTLHKVHFHNRSPEHLRAVCVSLLTTYSQLHAERIGRIYGGGVLKFEIKDARSIPILLPDRVSTPAFKRIDTALRSGAFGLARQLADRAVLPFFCGDDWERLRNQMDSELRVARLARGVADGTF